MTQPAEGVSGRLFVGNSPAVGQNLVTIATQPDQKEWYQQGAWPLIGAVATIIVANVMAIIVVFLQSRNAFMTTIRTKQIEQITTSLREFYEPILALIDINKEIFEKTGPVSFPVGPGEREAAFRVWGEAKKKILENNADIAKILREKKYLLIEEDNFEKYRELFTHVMMYEIFQDIKTDLYAKFRFPTHVRMHINAMRDIALQKRNRLHKGKMS